MVRKNHDYKNECPPQIFVSFSNHPNSYPLHFFKQLESTIGNFIWLEKVPRIRKQTLWQTRERGGLAVTNFKRYYQASMLQGIVDWALHCNTKAWVDMEEAWTSVPLAQFPWCTLPQDTKQLLNLSPISPMI